MANPEHRHREQKLELGEVYKEGSFLSKKFELIVGITQKLTKLLNVGDDTVERIPPSVCARHNPHAT